MLQYVAICCDFPEFLKPFARGCGVARAGKRKKERKKEREKEYI